MGGLVYFILKYLRYKGEVDYCIINIVVFYKRNFYGKEQDNCCRGVFYIIINQIFLLFIILVFKGWIGRFCFFFILIFVVDGLEYIKRLRNMEGFIK